MAASKKEEKKPIMSCASSGHITKLKQSIFATFDIYGDSTNKFFCGNTKGNTRVKILLLKLGVNPGSTGHFHIFPLTLPLS